MGGALTGGKGTDKEFSNDRMSLNPDQSKRRTVYLPLRRSNLPSVLTLFDFGDATTPGEGRSQTNVAPQALYMMNGEFVAARARSLAEQLLADTALEDDGRVAPGILSCPGRPRGRPRDSRRARLHRPFSGSTGQTGGTAGGLEQFLPDAGRLQRVSIRSLIAAAGTCAR